MKRFIVLLFLFLASCSTFQTTGQPISGYSSSPTITPEINTTAPDAARESPLHTSPTSTAPPSISIVTSNPPSIEAAALSTRVRELELTLTAVAPLIVTPYPVSTLSATDYPDNVVLVTFLDKSVLREIKSYNKAGRPVMRVREPRIKFYAGDKIWIYNDPIVADGGLIYYEIFDPDGVVEIRLFVRAIDINYSSPSVPTVVGAGYIIPKHILTVTFTNKSALRVVKTFNAAGKPVMKIFEPRIVFNPGDYTFVKPTPVQADGGDIFYELYDPDGEVTIVTYIRAIDIQLRTNHESIPVDVVKAKFTTDALLRVEDGTNASGKPIMKIYEPRVNFSAGAYIWIYANPVTADGGALYYKVYDSSGTYGKTVYIRKQDVSIPTSIE